MEKVFIKISVNNDISQQYLYWTWVLSFSGLLTKRRNPEKKVQMVLMVMVITQVVTVMVVVVVWMLMVMVMMVEIA